MPVYTGVHRTFGENNMKPVTAGLLVAAAACAASTVYFWNELDAERAHAAEVTASAKRLQAQVAELEKARADFSSRRMANAGAFVGGAFAERGPGPVSVTASATGDAGATAAAGFRALPIRPDRSPAMERMIRTQIRANNKRLYGDLVSQLGLGADDANKLYDLLTDQQTTMMDRMRPRDENGERPRFDDIHREQVQQLTDLLGADKAQALEDYQKTMPARGEVDMIARQLDGSDATLSDDQRKKLVSALTEERARVPAPEYSDGMDADQYSKSMADWQNNYNERAADRAKSILNSEQQTAFNEYQQWQTEMRQQMATLGGPGGRRFRMDATPAGVTAGGGVILNNVSVVAPAPSPDGNSKAR
jgi:hypothetical protein